MMADYGYDEKFYLAESAPDSSAQRTGVSLQSPEEGEEDAAEGIRDLSRFTDLAKRDFEEAVRLFYSQAFRQVLAGQDRQFLTAYKCFSQNPGNAYNVEAFLLEAKQKEPVAYSLEESEIRLADPLGDVRYALVIHREGWGYTRLRFQAEGAFLRLQEETADEVSFLGNVYRLHYHIDPEKLHEGCNLGAILISREEGTIRVPVIVSRHVREGRRRAFAREKKQLTVQLMAYYQAHRQKKVGAETWLSETERLLARMEQLDGNDLAVKLFHCQLLLAKEREAEAKWQLGQLQEAARAWREKEPALWCYYLYLTTLVSEDSAYLEETAKKVRQLHERRRGDWRIAWLALHLSEDCAHSPSRRWHFLAEQFSRHCTSPILYLEAWSLLCLNPAMLRELGPFEEQVLTYAVKHDLLQEDVMFQAVYLAGQKRGHSERLLRILQGFYRRRPHREALHQICSLLIQGNRSGADCLFWYQEGIAQNLRITRLYEHYMMSLPADTEIELPRMALLYFAYKSDLPWELNARLYAYVHRRREELADIYVNYMEAMERFVLEQIRRGHINRDLAYLYSQLLTLPMIDEDCARALATLLFVREVRVEGDLAKEVFVAHPCRVDVKRFALTANKAYVPIYESGARLFFGDGKGSMFGGLISCQVEALFRPERLALMIAPFVRHHLGYAVYACYERQKDFVVREDNVDLFALLSRSERIEEEEKKRIRRMVVDFYHEKDRLRELDEYLAFLRPEDVGGKDRGGIIHLLVERGMYEDAYQWVEQFGPHSVDPKTLLSLGSGLLHQDRAREEAEDPLLLDILLLAVRQGKHDERALQYLVRWFSGSIEEMRNLWLTAESFGVDVYLLSERMLLQMSATGERVGKQWEILRSYAINGGSGKIRADFAAACCEGYLLREEAVDPYLFESLRQLFREGETLHPVCEIAWLRYYADRERTEQTQELSRAFLERLLSQGVVFPFFKAYADCVPCFRACLEQTFVEHRADPGAQVTLHYRLLAGGRPVQDWVQEEMRDMFGGVYVSEFALFSGESLEYYVTGETEGRVRERKVACGDGAGEGKKGLLNELFQLMAQGGGDKAEALLQSYYRQEHMTAQIFTVRT